MKKEIFDYYYYQMLLGNDEARDKIIKETIPLIRYIVKTDYCFPNISCDLESIGKLALIKALETYNIDKGDFNYYLSNQVHWDINKFLSRQEKKWEDNDSLDAKISDEARRIVTLHDIVYDRSVPTVEEKVEFAMEYEAINKALMILPPLDKYVVELRYGFIGGKPLTLDKIKDMLGYQSISFLSRIIKRSLIKIKEYIETGIIDEKDKKNIKLNYLYSLDELKKQELFKTLKPKEKIVMDLYLNKSFLDNAQISQITGISHTHVQRLIKRSIEKISN